MKGTIIDFLNLASETPELSQEIVDLAMKYGFEFTDEVSEEQLDSVAGGASSGIKVKILWTPPRPTGGSAWIPSTGDESGTSSGTASSSSSGHDGSASDLKMTGGTT